VDLLVEAGGTAEVFPFSSVAPCHS
jgi:hypothetical protein